MAKTPEYCPNCSAAVPARARACPECGADEATGWSDAAEEDPLGLDTEFDYDEYVKRDLGGPKRQIKPANVRWLWWWVGVGLLLLFGFGLLTLFRR